MMLDRFAKRRECAVGYHAGKTAIVANSQQGRGRPHGDAPEELRLPGRFHVNELACCLYIAGLENAKCRMRSIALAVISQIKQQNAVTALVRLSGAFQQFETRTIQ